MESETLKNGVDQMSAEERKVYDRQIRLWGHAGQNKYEGLICGAICYFVLILNVFCLKVKINKSAFDWNAGFRSRNCQKLNFKRHPFHHFKGSHRCFYFGPLFSVPHPT